VRLQISQAVAVEAPSEAGGASNASGVVSASTIESVSVRFPDLKQPLDGFVVGKTVRVRVANQQGVHTATTRVLQVLTTPYVVVTLVAPRGFATQQQREFFRVAAKLGVHCKIVESSEPTAVGQEDGAAKTLDISGGGMRLSTMLTLRLGDRLELLVKAGLPRVPNPKVFAQVLRVGPGEGRPPATTSAGLKFVYANQREQDAFMLLMYELQRKSLT
jgi:c-di-GMP-binding flagellar brake protein YcgR